MKNIVILFVVFAAIIGNASSLVQTSVKELAVLPSAESRAVVVKFMGGITGFDVDAYQVVRSAMATLIVSGVVDHFITTAWGHEGGSEFCVQLNPDPSFTIEMVTNKLSVVKPGRQSIYEFKVQASCPFTNEP